MLVPRKKFHLESITKTKLKSAKKNEKAKAKKFTDNKIMYTTKCLKWLHQNVILITHSPEVYTPVNRWHANLLSALNWWYGIYTFEIKILIGII